MNGEMNRYVIIEIQKILMLMQMLVIGICLSTFFIVILKNITKY